jgi:hypothetical protein
VVLCLWKTLVGTAPCANERLCNESPGSQFSVIFRDKMALIFQRYLATPSARSGSTDMFVFPSQKEPCKIVMAKQ